MLLTINGDLNRYYIQTLCMLFVPGAKFSESGDDSDIIAEFSRKDHEHGVEVSCKYTAHGRTAERTSFEPLDGASVWLRTDGDSSLRERASKLAAGKASLAAGKVVFGIVPSWGILTGIRPAKMASSLLTALDDNGAKLNSPSGVRSLLVKEFMLNPRKASLAVDIAKNEQKIARIAKQGKTPTCSIYISIPFCPTRCSYCSFVSYTSKRLLSLIPAYIDRLISDLETTFEYIKANGFKVVTIYIGGGTPTTLDEVTLERLLSVISKHTDMAKLAEFTLEGGRPDTITDEKLKIAKALGVNRMSINPQTLRDDILREIGRRHTVDDFYRAYTMAKNSGIEIINTDLIAGLPGDDFAGFSKSVDKIIALEPENVTIHTFCVKKSAEILKINTEIYNRSADQTMKSVDYSQVSLKNAGYSPYYIYRQKNSVGNLENVGFSKKGFECLYNVFMMEEMHTIFAVGAGAVTKLVAAKPNGKKQIKRIYEPKYPYEYLASDKNEAMERNLAEIDDFFASVL